MADDAPPSLDAAQRAADMAAGRRVLAAEAAALADYADTLGETFAEAVALIMAARGRVIVSGMGKSGHVARKIAATLASTGTPAHFVHPAEASHGDLGMITTDDVALVLSNSGETRELADVIAHTRRFGIPLIGVASRPGSTLLRAADVALTLPQVPEVGPGAVAPTTSTTLTIALGDALAVALMERRGFTVETFRQFHPGGKLGAQLVAVADLMAKGDRLPLIVPDTPMPQALLEISAKGFGVAGLVGPDGGLCGIITDGDLRRHMDGLMEKRAAEVATPAPLTIAPDRLAQEALRQMNERKITCLFVAATPGGAPLGLVHVHDCLRAGVDAGPETAAAEGN
ncbi:MAG: KpsF/GutQ family sugar-phosphate isomerase [Pseudomonadota bacterium]